MRVKLFAIGILVAVSIILVSCNSNAADEANVVEREFKFSEIETGLLFVDFIINDISTNSIYILGVESMNSSASSIKILNAETLESSDFEHYTIFDETQIIRALFPHKNGYWTWVYAENLSSDGGITAEDILLKTYSSDFESVSTMHIKDYLEKTPNLVYPDSENYSYHIWGSTSEGQIVISKEEDTIFSLNSEGDFVRTWDISNKTKDSKMRFYRAAVYGDEIFCFLTDVGSGNTEIVKLLPDGNIEKIYTLDKVYINYFVGGDGRIYMADPCDLYVINKDGDVDFLFRWSEVGDSYFMGLVVLDENKYLALYRNKVFFVTKDWDDAEDTRTDTRKELTLACFGENGNVHQRVNDFNRNNEEYQIKIHDYSLFADSVTMLNLDIIAGKAPDMICWSNPFWNKVQSTAYIKAGQLVDLYTLMDQDTEINRSTFLPNLLKAVESSNESLYELPLEFLMYVVAGKTDVVGTEPGWTVDIFYEFLKQYPDADKPFGMTSWEILLSLMIYNNSDTYIDWENGQCYFDSNEFISLLELTKFYGEEAQRSILPHRVINEGRQLLIINLLSQVSSIQKFKALFNSEVNFIGFPTSKGIGNAFVLDCSVSIFAQSENVEVCWQFLRGLVTYQEQIAGTLLFPANYEALQKRLNNPTEYEEPGTIISYYDNDGGMWSVTLKDATPEESEQVRQVIESCDRVYRENRAVMAIIEEEVPSYLYGDKTAEEVARIIQDRAQNYVSEQMD